MVALAIAAVRWIPGSTMEVDALEKRYTVDTLEQMRADESGRRAALRSGHGHVSGLRDMEELSRACSRSRISLLSTGRGFAFREDLAPHRVLREGEQVTLPETPGVFYLPFVEQPISSTAIRDACRRGEDASGWVPPAVWSYIEKHKLYS